MTQLQIIDDKKKNYRKKYVISACNVITGLGDKDGI